MKAEIKKKLKDAAEEAARRFSDKSRERNFSQEDFAVHRIVPLSEFTAVVIFLKSSGLFSIAFFYHVKEYWNYFFPTDSHLLGMRYVEEWKKKIEDDNFNKTEGRGTNEKIKDRIL